MWFKKRSNLALTIITAILILLSNTNVGLAQTEFNPFPYDIGLKNIQIFRNSAIIPKAPVVIDGKEIFSVGQIEGHAASDRAEKIQSDLMNVIDSPQPPEIKIQEENRLPVIYLNGEYLFTVTQEDTIGQEPILERAKYIKKRIEQSISNAKQERSFAYIQRQIIITCVILLLALMFSRLLDQLQTYPLRKAIQRIIPGLPSNNTAQPSNLTTLFRLKLGFAQFGLWIGIILIISRLFPLSRQWLYLIFNLIINTFNKSLFNFGGNQFSIINLLILLGLFISSIIFSGYLTDLLRTNVLQVTRMTRGSQEIIYIITKYGLIALCTVVLLQAYGLNLSSLALIGSALGVGIGFGFQDIAKNFASGIVLLFERSIQVGDFVQVGQHLGVVEEVRTRSIVLKTLDRIAIIVPNSRFLSEEVINWNHRKSVSRLHLPIGVAYGSDVKKVKSALLQAAEEHSEVLRNPQAQVFFTDFGDSSLNFELLVWTSEPSRQALLKSDLYFRIEEIFNEQRIDIPFPQRDINLRTDDLPIKLSPQLENHLLYLLKGLIAKQYNNNEKP
jgi:potassium-dependent mechanosensitive channel